MQQCTRLVNYITGIYLYFSKKIQTNPTNITIKWCQEKSYSLFLQGFDPHSFQLVYDLLFQSSPYLHESEAM